MTTITVNVKTKAGKTLLELAKILSESSEGVVINAGFDKLTSKTKTESTYNPEFVEMVLDSAKHKKGKVVNPDDIWGSLK